MYLAFLVAQHQTYVLPAISSFTVTLSTLILRPLNIPVFFLISLKSGSLCNKPLLQSLLQVKQEGSEADRSPQSSAQVKNGGNIPPLPPYVFMA